MGWQMAPGYGIDPNSWIDIEVHERSPLGMMILKPNHRVYDWTFHRSFRYVEENTMSEDLDIDDEEITFEEFMKELRSDVDKFEKEYKANMSAQPAMYPATMDRVDWSEQFIEHYGFAD